MTVRGYIKYRDDVSSLYGVMQQLVDSGVSSDRIVMDSTPTGVIGSLDPGDRLVVSTLYDVANGLPSLMRHLSAIACRGAVLESLSEPWFRMGADATDWASFFEGLAVFGSRAVAARTRSALSDAVSAGQKLGRPVGSISAQQAEKYRRGFELYRRGMSVAAISRELPVNRASFTRWLDANYPEERSRRRPDRRKKEE